MSKKIGLIAEDKSDIEVITEIIAKYIPRNQFSIKSFVGNGCGKLKQKCDSWVAHLVGSGCDYVFIFLDLDRNNFSELKKALEGKVSPKSYPQSLIVIPVEELEAWLLADGAAIKSAFSLEKAPKYINNSESIPSPKEYIAKIVYEIGKKRYLNTVHNKKISEHVTLENLRRCASFSGFDKYVTEKIGGGAAAVA